MLCIFNESVEGTWVTLHDQLASSRRKARFPLTAINRKGLP